MKPQRPDLQPTLTTELWVEPFQPIFSSSPTLWIADEDAFTRPYDTFKKCYLSVIAQCLSARKPHQFILWTRYRDLRDALLVQAQNDYDDLISEPNALPLFTYPFPNVDYPDWSDRVALPPVMDKKRQRWLTELTTGTKVKVTAHYPDLYTVEKTTAIIGELKDGFLVRNLRVQLSKKSGFATTIIDNQTAEIWITPN